MTTKTGVIIRAVFGMTEGDEPNLSMEVQCGVHNCYTTIQYNQIIDYLKNTPIVQGYAITDIPSVFVHQKIVLNEDETAVSIGHTVLCEAIMPNTATVSEDYRIFSINTEVQANATFKVQLKLQYRDDMAQCIVVQKALTADEYRQMVKHWGLYSFHVMSVYGVGCLVKKEQGRFIVLLDKQPFISVAEDTVCYCMAEDMVS